jgi:5'(3')-deoxyribonucleotidase
MKTFMNLDCDGVLANFIKGACIAHGRPYYITRYDFYTDWGMDDETFWSKCRGRDFWVNLEKYEYADDFVQRIRELCKIYDAELTICTSPSLDPESISGKLEWLYKHFNIKHRDIMLGPKKWSMAHYRSILIDDNQDNIRKFNEHGGHGILFPQQWGSCSEGWQNVADVAERILRDISLSTT